MTSDSFLTHRLEWYEYQLLDLAFNVQEVLNVTPGGSLTDSSTSEIRSSGSFVCAMNQARAISWGRSLVRVVYHMGDTERVMMTGIPGVGDDSFTATFDQVSVQLYDRTLALRDDPIAEVYALPADTDCIAKVLELINSVGDFPIIIPVPAVPIQLGVAKTWQPNTTKLEIINELLKAAGYREIYADELGRLRSELYIDPMVRPIVWPFANDRDSVMIPTWRRGRDLLAVPNRIRMIRATEGSTPADIAVAVNQDPSSEFSYQNRGNRWITKVIPGVAATSFAVLQQQAKAELTRLSQAASTFEIEHPVLPIRADDVATFKHSKLDGQLFRTVAQELSYTLQTGRMVRGTYQEVVDVSSA